MNKKELLRIRYKEKRKNIKQKENKDLAIFNKVSKLKQLDKYETVLIYISTIEEVDTRKLIKYFLKTKKVAVPKIINKKMCFCYISNMDNLVEGPYKILEPTNNDFVIDFSSSVCIVPGICFSKDNHRIGYGGGYYDRFLSGHNIFSIGICYKECMIESFPYNDFDEKVDLIITD